MIVVDTSVIVKLAIPEVRSDSATRLRGDVLAAPPIWQAEAGNTFWRKIQIKQITQVQALPLLRALLNMIVTLDPADDDTEGALKLAVALEHPTYDCFFLDAAIRHDTYVVTDDTRFVSAVRRHRKYTSRVRLLSEF